MDRKVTIKLDATLTVRADEGVSISDVIDEGVIAFIPDTDGVSVDDFTIDDYDIEDSR